MKSDQDCDVPITQSVAPSFGDPTRTSEPTPRARHALEARASSAHQLRDPGRYHIVGEHGRGGLGRVSRARDHELGRDVAIKELIARDPMSEIRFVREALITARLEHPGIVPVYEAGRWPDGTPFYAMKLVAGRSLRELLAERTTVAERIGLLHHVIAVADAIAYAHDRHIIHRDLKPANIIVGDFGETIVIDWGLAKDLTAVHEACPPGNAPAGSRDSHLTSTGSVMGTPAYMPPEQERGEHVDQRADVFAIGAMLWELCALSKVPPAHAAPRHRMLRQNGIERDLVAIVDKALDRDPLRRYPNAGALAADLKSFKSGARIAARHYSLLAMLLHWTRRHRALAVSTLVVITLTIAGAAFHVRNIAVERDRADAALVEAETAKNGVIKAQHATEAALAEQTLKRVELLLSTDPSAALDVLATYMGDDELQPVLLRAQAKGRGLARLRVTPHADLIFWAQGLRDQSVATLSADGTIAISDAAGRSKVVARDVMNKDTIAYTRQRQLLAYACKETSICLLDLSLRDPVVLSELRNSHPDGLAFSSDGALLAAISHDGVALVWDISLPQQPKEILRTPALGWNIRFLDEQTLSVVNTDRTQIISFRGGATQLEIRNVFTNDVSHRRHLLAIGTKAGTAALVGPSSTTAGAMTKLCDGPLNTLRFMPDPRWVAFGCQSGSVGIWDTKTMQVRSLGTLLGSADSVVPDAQGRYIAAGGSSGLVTVFDLETRITTAYAGHHVRVSDISAPDENYPYFVSADANGNVRVWPCPIGIARVAYKSTTRLMDTQVLPGRVAAIGTSGNASIHFEEEGSSRDVEPHEAPNRRLRMSADGDHFSAFGWGGAFEVWSAREHRRLHLVSTQQTDTTQLAFTSDVDIVCAGNDGRILRWSPTDGLSVLAVLPRGIATFVVLPGTHQLVVALSDGELWLVSRDGAATRVQTQREQARELALSADGKWLATGNDRGVVAVYETQTWTPSTVLKATGAIRRVVFSPRMDMIAVASKGGWLHLGTLSPGSEGSDLRSGWLQRPIEWKQLVAPAHHLEFSPDGDLFMAACGDGAVWFHSTHDQRWVYFPTGAADITILRSTADGRRAASADTSGRLMWFDLTLVRKLLHAF